MSIGSRVGGNLAERAALVRSPAGFLAGEATGALGDLGTFIPAVVALVQVVGMDPAAILVFAGLMNVCSGLAFGIPIAVQPMKAIAALAIAGTLSAGQMAGAGLAVGLAVLLLSGFGLVGWVQRVVPKAVVGALQLTVGFRLALAAVRMMLFESGAGRLHPATGPNGLVVAGVAFILMIVLFRRTQWLGLALTGLGLGLACLARPSLLATPQVEMWQPNWSLDASAAVSGVWKGGLAQLPLTLLNSVLAVSALAATLFPQRSECARPRKVAVSVGLMNLIACPFGGMPMCHGSGGLAGQHRFGARSGLSMVMLGTGKLLVGLLLGGAALAWMQAFPRPVLGVFLLLAGVELGRASGCTTNWRIPVAAAAMTALYYAGGGLALGFVAGWGLYALLPAEAQPPEGAKE
ncbi:MAG: putative sulfate/molybdate transporter [Planctomycetota bacterium]